MAAVTVEGRSIRPLSARCPTVSAVSWRGIRRGWSSTWPRGFPGFLGGAHGRAGPARTARGMHRPVWPIQTR